MITRRSIAVCAVNLVAAEAFGRAAKAQDQTELRNRGAPTGRVGAATRNGNGGETEQTLELLAPLVGIGLSSSDQPTLCYLLSGPTSRPLRFVLSLRNQPRPVADLALTPPRPPGQLGVVHLRDHNVRLAANALYVWSVAIQADHQPPSHDLVASALIQYRPIDPARLAEVSQAEQQRNYTALEASGYWYDAAALAEASRTRDGGAALQQVLRAMGLGGPNGPG